ncbi:MAG: OB-fold domain-containing protein [Actinomycetota bacterium]|nr:OB-fold domain-containing protein [Actinomycetota bacterium]
MARVPIEPGYFTVPDDPQEPPLLLGSRCPSCGEHFYPRRLVCAKCLHEGCDDVELGPTGRLWTWTFVHVPLFAKKDGSVDAYGVGQIDLPEGPRVQAILVGGEDFEIGMELRLDLETLSTDRDGNDVVIYRFAPTAAA